MIFRYVLLALLTATLAVSACGRKGDPVRPGQEEKQQKNSS
ncbi:MAG: lipoprotein [Pseudomonadota bacterium]